MIRNNGLVRLYLGAVGVASLLTLVVMSSPGLSFWIVAPALYWLILAVILTSWIWEPSMAGQRRRALLASLAVALGTALLVMTDAPLHARFALSESSLERHARSVRADHDGGQWWGLYQVHTVEKIAGGTRFLVTDTGLDWLSHGFVYLPDGPGAEGHRYEHFRGPWYRWRAGP